MKQEGGKTMVAKFGMKGNGKIQGWLVDEKRVLFVYVKKVVSGVVGEYLGLSFLMLKLLSVDG
jgi:hypothetical protein